MGLFSRKTSRKIGKRAFEAVTKLAFQQNWFGINDSINVDLVHQNESLIGHARKLAKDEPMAVRYLSLHANNVVGSGGLSFHSQATDAKDPSKRDEMAARAVEKAYKRFCKVVDVTGKNTLNQLYRLIAKSEARDGSVFIIEHFGPKVNKFGYGLQVIDSLRLARDKNRAAAHRQNAIISGIEINEFGRPLAYWFYPELTGNPLLGTVKKGQPVRHPAERVIHFYSQEFPEQVDGYSRMHAAMLRMNLLSRYQKSAGVAAAVGAAKMGFFITEGDDTNLGQLADEETETNGFVAEAVPGRIGALPPGVSDFKSFDPDYPHAMYSDFVKENKRDISTALCVSYHGLSGDLEGVNFSSIRTGVLNERDEWMTLQDDLITGPGERITDNFIKHALLSGEIRLDSGAVLNSSEIGRLSPYLLRGRRWPWVDPLKDEQANEKAVNNFTQSPYEVAASKGVDLDDVLDDAERFQNKVREKKLVPMSTFTGSKNPEKEGATPKDGDDKDENGDK